MIRSGDIPVIVHTGGYEGLSQIDITSYPGGPGTTGICQGVIYEGPLPPEEYIAPPSGE